MQGYAGEIFRADRQGGLNAKTVIVHQLAFDTETRRLSIRSRLVPVAGALIPTRGRADTPDDVDRRTDRLAKYWTERAYRGLKDTFGYNPPKSSHSLTSSSTGLTQAFGFRPTNLTKLIGAAMRARVPEARAAIYNSGSIRVDDLLGPGTLRMYDIFRILPYQEKVISVKLKGQLLFDLLNQGETMPDKGGFLQKVGIARGDKGGWEIGGEPIQKGELYPI